MKKVNKNMKIEEGQIHIVDDKTGEIWLSNATEAMRDFEKLSKENPNFSLIFPVDSHNLMR